MQGVYKYLDKKGGADARFREVTVTDPSIDPRDSPPGAKGMSMDRSEPLGWNFASGYFVVHDRARTKPNKLAGARDSRGRYLSALVNRALVLGLTTLSASAYAANVLPARWMIEGSIGGNGCPLIVSTPGFNTCAAAYKYFDEYYRACNPAAAVSDNPCRGANDFQTIWTIFPFGSWNPIARVRSYCDDGSASGARYDDAGNYFYCEAPPYSKRLNAGAPRYCEACQVGNPVHPATGNKFQAEQDYAGQGPFPLQFVRYHNTQLLDATTGAIGANWTHSYSRRLLYDTGMATPAVVSAVRQDGKELPFNLVGGLYVGDTTFTDKLERIATGWRLANSRDEVELYDTRGRLTSITNRAGLVQTLSYDGAGRLGSVTDPFGRALTFTYDNRSRIQTMTAPGGLTFQYTYTSENLTRVTYPDTTSRIYHYEIPTYPYHLTGITDENGQRFSTYSYDTAGLANATEHAGGAGRVTIVNSTASTTRNVTVTRFVGSSQSAARTYTYLSVLGVAVNAAVSGPACPSCGPAARTYDANGNVTSQTDWNGSRTNYLSYDLNRNLELIRTEGLTAGGSIIPNVSRSIWTQWHPVYRLPTGIAQPLRITTMVYGEPTDSNPGNRGSLLSKTLQATTNPLGGAGFGATPTGAPRTWTYTYNTSGQMLTMNGPRTDVPDVTTYTYYANDATCPGASAIGCRGQLETVTNALGHVTRIAEYNAHGQPLAITDPNGLTTTLAYDLRQRLTSRSVGGETTDYAYDNAGQLTRVTLPDGSFLSYTYDAAHRLTQIADSLGNRIVYTLDVASNRTKEEVFDPANQLAQTRSRVFNNLNRLAQEIGAAGQTTAYGYDNQGNVTSIDGPLAGTVDVTTNGYDALNRLIRVTDPHSGQVNYGYNGLDQLTSVSDPRTLTTSYGYDGLSNLNQQVSPDTGTTTNTYDEAGNLLTQTDAKGQVTRYAYDPLNRVTSIAFHDGSRQDFAYDQGVNGVGRLTAITETGPANQVTSSNLYRYDAHGRVVSETRTLNGVPYTTGYGYDGAGRLTEMRYPSGRILAYGYDVAGRVSQISTTVNDQAQVIAQDVQYRPFGGVGAFTLGNGQAYSRGHDQDGRIANYTLGAQAFAVGYDSAGRITSLGDAGSPASANSYGYDNLDRLTAALAPGTAFGYSYDAVGNRLSKLTGSSTEVYGYGGTSNRLSSVTPISGPLRNYLHDANGSVTADGINTYAYDARGRLAQANSVIGATAYQVNALGQRVRKTSALGDTVFHYDVQGRLIAESTPGGQVRKEYLYLGDIPVAVIQ